MIDQEFHNEGDEVGVFKGGILEQSILVFLQTWEQVTTSEVTSS